jgi:phosphatidylglycerophosphatase A
MRRLAVLVATGFGIGRMPVAPATWASLAVALLLALLAAVAPTLLAPIPLGIAILVLLPVAIWASGEAERDLGTDAHPIVADEVVGMLVSVWGIARLSEPHPAVVLGAAFFLFRFFDIVKPFPIGRSQRLPGGIGIVVDDVLAGAATNLVLRALIALGLSL